MEQAENKKAANSCAISKTKKSHIASIWWLANVPLIVTDVFNLQNSFQDVQTTIWCSSAMKKHIDIINVIKEIFKIYNHFKTKYPVQ